jgi:hypothetical protein
MRFIENDFNSVSLIKDDNSKIDFMFNERFKYNGVYYKKKENSNNFNDLDEVVVPFIGTYVTYKGSQPYYNVDMTISGVFLKPEYIYIGEWHKIVNLNQPKRKYFLYPHLICTTSLDEPLHNRPLPYASSIEKISLDNIVSNKEIELYTFENN